MSARARRFWTAPSAPKKLALCVPPSPNPFTKGEIWRILNQVHGQDTGSAAKASTFVRRMDLLFSVSVRNVDGRITYVQRSGSGISLVLQYWRKINWESDCNVPRYIASFRSAIRVSDPPRHLPPDYLTPGLARIGRKIRGLKLTPDEWTRVDKFSGLLANPAPNANEHGSVLFRGNSSFCVRSPPGAEFSAWLRHPVLLVLARRLQSASTQEIILKATGGGDEEGSFEDQGV
ncbi:hypothetical protein B0H14DRAFT_2565097 [Mycena olivaceomarginata]|nr:hypothetical protein B0H14DRAFT_2565097 [Mycena olivaceomarginata]